MLGALLYLRLTSVKNQVLTRTLRLREPKYLAGALATIAYFYFFVFRRWGGPMPGGSSSRVPPFDPLLIGASLGIVVMVAWVLYAWVFPARQPALRFSPAEIGFLFPAPIPRRTLIHFSLLSSQLKILFSAMLFGLIWSRRGFTVEGAAMRMTGWWILFSAAELHKAGANLTFAQMRERGWNMAQARMLAIGVAGLFFGLVAFSLWRSGRWPALAEAGNGATFAAYLASQLDAGWLHWLLAPFRIAANPFLAPNGRRFLIALGPALVLVAAHYFWVMSLEVSFEEGSIAQAEKRAQALAARAAGASPFRPVKAKARREPFPLRPRGRPEIAFLWKNLLSMGTVINARLLRLIGPMLVLVVFLLNSGGGHAAPAHLRAHAHSDAAAVIVLIVAAMVAFYTLLVGPQLARQDLRSDLANVDLLKTYPLAGWQVMLGEMLAPIAILSGLLWLALVAATWAAGALPGQMEWLAAGHRFIFALCIASLVPPLCTLELIVPNAAMLLFPGWHQTGRPRGAGFEMMGQRLIFVLGQRLAVLLMLLPAIVAAPVLIFATQWMVGLPAAAVLATVAVLAIIGGEVWCGLWWLGRRFERLDLSTELKNP
jgi:ABC-2 type transport system permease protein